MVAAVLSGGCATSVVDADAGGIDSGVDAAADGAGIDGGTRVDGGTLFDGHVDAAGAPENVGASCTTDADCPGSGAVCLTDARFPGGYCSQSCGCFSDGCADSGPTCPTGSTCVMQRVGGICMRECDPAAATRECRHGYGCGSGWIGVSIPAVCVGGCTDDTDCPSGRSCDRSGVSGTCFSLSTCDLLGAGSCFNPSASPGDPCATHADCPTADVCLSEHTTGLPGGTCVSVDACDLPTNAGCAGGSCTAAPWDGGRFCTAACARDADCRAGYSCQPVPGVSGRSYCAPRCTTDADCTVGGYVCDPATSKCAAACDAVDHHCTVDGYVCDVTNGLCVCGGTAAPIDCPFP